MRRDLFKTILIGQKNIFGDTRTLNLISFLYSSKHEPIIFELENTVLKKMRQKYKT